MGTFRLSICTFRPSRGPLGLQRGLLGLQGEPLGLQGGLGIQAVTSVVAIQLGYYVFDIVSKCWVLRRCGYCVSERAAIVF